MTLSAPDFRSSASWASEPLTRASRRRAGPCPASPGAALRQALGVSWAASGEARALHGVSCRRTSVTGATRRRYTEHLAEIFQLLEDFGEQLRWMPVDVTPGRQGDLCADVLASLRASGTFASPGTASQDIAMRRAPIVTSATAHVCRSSRPRLLTPATPPQDLAIHRLQRAVAERGGGSYGPLAWRFVLMTSERELSIRAHGCWITGSSQMTV